MYIYLHYPPFLSDILFIYNPQDLSDTTIADSQVASSKLSVLRSSYFCEGLNKRKIYTFTFFWSKAVIQVTKMTYLLKFCH